MPSHAPQPPPPFRTPPRPTDGGAVVFPFSRLVAWVAMLSAVGLLLVVMQIVKEQGARDRWLAVLNLVTTYRLDWIVFGLLSIASLGATDSWLRRRRCPSGSGLRTWLLLIALVLAGAAAADAAASREKNNLKQRVQGLAPTYAAELARLGHARLRLDAAPRNPLYLALIDAQLRWLALNPFVNDIYTFRRQPNGDIVLVVDSETDYDHNGAYEGEREARTAIGERYQQDGETGISDPLRAAFEGRSGFEDVPYSDRWGTWISAYVPMLAADGTVEAVLGVDYAAGDWVTSIAWSRAAALGFVGIMIVTLIGSATSIGLVRSELARREETETLLRRAATHDKLTGLPNRALLMARLTSVVRRARAGKPDHFALLFLDFDRFKLINDTLGHEAGDKLLVSIAGRLCDICEMRLRHSSRGTDLMCARMGGDEFVLLASGLSDLNEVNLLSKDIQESLSAPHWLREQEVRSTPSVGITTSAHGYERAEDMVRDADLAMYQAKSRGRNCAVMFDESMRAAAVARVTLENDLRQAIERRELTLAYQPIVALSAGRLTGFEALVRWCAPERGWVPPAEFLAIAEETGLIVPLGEFVLRNAMLQSQAWRKMPEAPRDFAVHVNLSRGQLQSADLVRSIERLLWETGADAHNIVLEVTESAVMDDPERAVHTLADLRSLGFQLYMDDFCTGHSSLNALHRFGLDGVKIDCSFIATLCERRDYAAIVEAIIGLAHNLDMCLIAEGIETQPQVDLLQTLNCDCGQGFHFARPMPVDQATREIANWSQRSATQTQAPSKAQAA